MGLAGGSPSLGVVLRSYSLAPLPAGTRSASCVWINQLPNPAACGLVFPAIMKSGLQEQSTKMNSFLLEAVAGYGFITATEK